MGEQEPGRLRWRPGVYVVRRDAAHLQVGVDPPLRAVVPDSPAVRAALRHLAPADEPEADHALRTLRAAGLLLAGGQPGSSLGVPPAARRAAEAQFGEEASRRLAARSGAGVEVRADRGLRATVGGLLRGAGVAVVDGADADRAPSLVLVVTVGEPARDEVDPLVREGAPHLLVSLGATARVGPLVVPGATACLRCVDARLAETDPRRPLVVEQVVRVARAAGDVPVDPTLTTLALAWAVRDLCRYLEGDRPATWSAVVEVGADGPMTPTAWVRHPHCGCAWDVLA